MHWAVPRIWNGGDVWILGGGQSVVQQFQIPSDIVKKVLNGTFPISTYSPFLEPIHNKHVIGINAAFEIGDWMDMVFFGDGKYFLSVQEKLAAFPKLKVSCAPVCRNLHWVKYLDRDGSRKHGITNDPTKVSWNDNSGAAAISVAAHAGAKRIFLLGFDMKMTSGEKHWHRSYTKGKPLNKPANAPVPFAMHLAGFPNIKLDAEKRGIEIYNVCPDSALTVFPRITLQEALRL